MLSRIFRQSVPHVVVASIRHSSTSRKAIQPPDLWAKMSVCTVVAKKMKETSLSALCPRPADTKATFLLKDTFPEYLSDSCPLSMEHWAGLTIEGTARMLNTHKNPSWPFHYKHTSPQMKNALRLGPETHPEKAKRSDEQGTENRTMKKKKSDELKQYVIEGLRAMLEAMSLSELSVACEGAAKRDSSKQ